MGSNKTKGAVSGILKEMVIHFCKGKRRHHPARKKLAMRVNGHGHGHGPYFKRSYSKRYCNEAMERETILAK